MFPLPCLITISTGLLYKNSKPQEGKNMKSKVSFSLRTTATANINITKP